MAKRKLRDVRIELQARLGYGSVDQPALAPILNSFLREAQEQLYQIGTFKDLSTYWDVTVASGSANIAYPTTPTELNPDKITDVRVNTGTVGAPNWQPVIEGIRPSDYTNVGAGIPARYERRSDGFELSPPRDKAYTVRVFAMRKLDQIREDDDTFDIDDSLCFQVALAAAKEHYRHPDAKTYLNKAGSVLSAVKWNNTGPKLIRPADKEDDTPDPRPVVI